MTTSRRDPPTSMWEWSTPSRTNSARSATRCEATFHSSTTSSQRGTANTSLVHVLRRRNAALATPRPRPPYRQRGLSSSQECTDRGSPAQRQRDRGLSRDEAGCFHRSTVDGDRQARQRLVSRGLHAPVRSGQEDKIVVTTSTAPLGRNGSATNLHRLTRDMHLRLEEFGVCASSSPTSNSGSVNRGSNPRPGATTSCGV